VRFGGWHTGPVSHPSLAMVSLHPPSPTSGDNQAASLVAEKRTGRKQNAYCSTWPRVSTWNGSCCQYQNLWSGLGSVGDQAPLGTGPTCGDRPKISSQPAPLLPVSANTETSNDKHPGPGGTSCLSAQLGEGTRRRLISNRKVSPNRGLWLYPKTTARRPKPVTLYQEHGLLSQRNHKKSLFLR
jgi:hypothetical protein